MKTAVVTATYPGAEAFLEDFARSLRDQDTKAFTVVVANDRLPRDLVLDGLAGLDVRIVDGSSTPGVSRKAAIRAAAALGCETIVFADADDTCAENRISASVEALRSAPVVFNDLILFGPSVGAKRSMFAGRFAEGAVIGAEEILHGNCLGLSNTSSLGSVVLECLDAVPDDVVAFDWALFTRVLLGGHSARFAALTHTNYRQHSGNVAGLVDATPADVLRGLEIMEAHYRFFAESGDVYRKLALDCGRLRASLSEDGDLLERYVDRATNGLGPGSIWWEHLPVRRSDK